MSDRSVCSKFRIWSPVLVRPGSVKMIGLIGVIKVYWSYVFFHCVQSKTCKQQWKSRWMESSPKTACFDAFRVWRCSVKIVYYCYQIMVILFYESWTVTCNSPITSFSTMRHTFPIPSYSSTTWSIYAMFRQQSYNMLYNCNYTSLTLLTFFVCLYHLCGVKIM